MDDLEGGERITTDNGGVTKWGISSRSHPGVDVVSLTRDEAKEIYRTEYWEEVEAGKYPWPMNLIVFDAAINQGTAFANHLGTSAVDYVEALLLRIQRYNDIYRRNHSMPLHGWVNRVMKIYDEVQA